MKNGKELEKLILDRFDRLENKVDEIRTKSLPDLERKYAVLKAETTSEAKGASKVYGAIWGGVTLVVSLVGLAIAYFK